MASSRCLCFRKAWQANQPSECSSQFANTLAKLVCSCRRAGQPSHAQMGFIRPKLQQRLLVPLLKSGVRDDMAQAGRSMLLAPTSAVAYG